ncbi:MAG: response regulator [Proteobacteria bacterium]|nr:response regulator [Pseudomonadota bacterium]
MTKRVLIVDDEPTLRELLGQSLEELADDGVVLHFATDGLEGVSQFREHRPDVVLLDVMMPGMNGYEVCEVIKNDHTHTSKVMMLTARGQAFDKVQGQMVGADHYMTKPFDPDDVLAIVRHWLELG